MKILCVIPYYYPAFQYGGPIASVHGLNRALVKNGIDVTVYTTNAGLDREVKINREAVVDGVKVVYFNLSKLFGLHVDISWQFSIEMTKALKRNISKFDVIYVNGLWNYPAAVACHYSRRYCRPYIISPRGMLYRYTMGKKAWKKWPYYQLISKRDMQGASAIHYTTRDEAEQCHARLCLNNSALIVSNGVDASAFAQLPDGKRLIDKYPVLEGKRVLLFVSRISWKKGLDILIKAFANISKSRRDIHLLIAGPDEGGYVEKVKGWCSDEGVQGSVTFTGMLRGKDKLNAFSVSDIFVLPSYSENFGMAVVEAMACGLPVVISDQVGICDVVRQGRAGLIVETNVDQLASALARLIDEPDLCAEMGVLGKKLVVNEYSWSHIAGSMINAFNVLRTR